MSDIVNFQPQITDWSKASVNKCVDNSVVTVGGPTFSTILNVTGKGYIKKIISNLTVTTDTAYLRVTVDGTVTMYLISNVSDARFFGFIIEDLISYNSSNLACGRSLGQAYPLMTQGIAYYPETGQVDNLIIGAVPVYFNSNILIEASSGIPQFLTYSLDYVAM